MSVQNPKSTAVTNYVAVPVVPTRQALAGGKAFVACGVCESTAATALDDTSKMRFFRLPVDAILHSLVLGTDDFGNAGVAALGLYSLDPYDNSITVVDADEFAGSLDINAAAVAPTERRFTNHGIETAEYPLWQIAGLTARPTTYDHFEVVLTITTTTQTAGTAYCRALYTV